MSDIAIKVENLGKLYRLGEVGTGTLSHDLNRWMAKVRGKEDPFAKIGEVNDRTRKGESDYVWALKDVSFEVSQGEVLGIIGRNGAGKSTLLKLLSKVTKPTSGQMKIRGRIASLLEVGTGFHPEMTGRENIFLNGAILGMTKREIRQKFDEIVGFAGVERYVDTPVKRYSSGMYVRLAFAVAAFLEPEILIVDEVLAVGDAEFQKKCLGRMKDVSVHDGRTVLFVSHNMGAIKNLCDRCLMLKDGTFSFMGSTDAAISRYLDVYSAQAAVYEEPDEIKTLCLSEIQVQNEKGEVSEEFMNKDDVYIRFSIRIPDKDMGIYSLHIQVLDEAKQPIFAKEARIDKRTFLLKIHKKFLTRGKYSLTAIIYIPAVAQFAKVEDVCSFQIIDSGTEFSHLGPFNYGTVFGNAEWIGA